MAGRYEQDEYLEQDDEEREAVGRRKSLIALLIAVLLVVAGLVLIDRLRSVSALQDCLTSRATHCADVVPETSR